MPGRSDAVLKKRIFHLPYPVAVMVLGVVVLSGECSDCESRSIEDGVFAEPLDWAPKYREVSPARRLDSDLNPTAIVLITLDTTRADHLGMYGYEQATSPALDQLASEGARWRR